MPSQLGHPGAPLKPLFYSQDAASGSVHSLTQFCASFDHVPVIVLTSPGERRSDIEPGLEEQAKLDEVERWGRLI